MLIRNHKQRSLFLITWLMLMAFSIFITGRLNAEPRKINVGVYQNMPKIFMDEKGKPSGFFIDIIEEIARNEGWTLNYVPGTWSECLNALENGQIDLMPDVAYSKEREEKYDFHNLPVVESWSFVYASHKAQIEGFLDLNNKRVAVLQNSIQQTTFQQMIAGLNINVSMVPVDSPEQAFEAVKNGLADAAIANHFFGDYFFKKYGMVKTTIVFNAVRLCFATTKGQNEDLLKAIDRNIYRWTHVPNSPYYQILSRWTGQAPVFRLPRYILWVIGTILAMIVIASGMILLLRHQVRAKTINLLQANEALKKTEEMLRLAMEATNDGIWDWYPNDGTIYWNPRSYIMLGYEPDEFPITMDRLLELLHPDDSEIFNPVLAQIKEGNHSFSYEIRLRKKEGSWAWINIRGKAVELDEQGEARRIIGTHMDITERKRAEAAEAANKAKSQFLARMSHELRTPLNAILGYSEMLQEEAEDCGQKNFIPDLQKIHAAGKHLLMLINDILDLTRIEAGKMVLYLETFDLGITLRDVVSTVKPLVDKNSNRLVVDYPSDIGNIHADLTKVRQVLFNLLSNASKFTQKGTITLRASRVMKYDKEWVVMSVEDSGIGMTPEQLKNLFKEFSQADTSTTRKYGGTGLGLAISKRFCEMMGGEISVSSEINKGSCFVAQIPVEVVSNKEEQKTAASAPASSATESKPSADTGNTILAIDDDPSVLDRITRFLEKEGVRVVTATGGEEGLRLAREVHPRVITLDVIMPGMDGWAVLKSLKADPVLANIPVIMFSMLDDKNMGYTLGVSDYMTKPIEKEHLSTILKRYRCVSPPCPVLVVEDDNDTREMVSRILQKEGWKVFQAENGRIGLEKLKEKIPTVILLDLMMPEMDGFEFLGELRKVDAWKHIPVVVVTAKTLTPEDHQRLNGYVHAIIQKGATPSDGFLRQIRDQVRIFIPKSKS